MSTRHDNAGGQADGPEDIDAAFAEIIAGLQDVSMPPWPEEPPARDDAETVSSPPEAGTAPHSSEGPRDWTAPDEDEGHYEPPEPPPLPRPKPATILGIAVIVIGVGLLLIPGLTGQGTAVTLPLGLVAVSAGIGWLLFRMRHGPPNDSDDDGARL